jgi:hypothetical protein
MIDLRDSPDVIESLRRKNEKPVTAEQGQKLAAEVGKEREIVRTMKGERRGAKSGKRRKDGEEKKKAEKLSKKEEEEERRWPSYSLNFCLLGAVGYVECSALLRNGLNKVFDMAISQCVGRKQPRPRKGGNCLLL